MSKSRKYIRKHLETAANMVELPSAEVILAEAAGRQRPVALAAQKPRRKRTALSISAAALACAAVLCAVLLLPAGKSPQHAAPPAPPTHERSDAPQMTDAPPAETPPSEVSEQTYYISFDVNPGIELMIDENGNIAQINAVNEDAQRLLAELDLSGRSAQEASAAIVDALISAGYIDPGKRTNTLLIGGLDNDALLSEVSLAVTAELGSSNAKTFVIEQKITDEAAVREIAETYHVTLGKAQYILNLSREDESADIGTLAEADLTTVFSAWNTIIDTKEAGEYDEYGQLVLYPIGYLEQRNAALVWERFSEDYREELKQVYTDEELAILYAPTVKVFTMPDFLGMTEAQVRAIANERGFVVKIVYSDVASPGGSHQNKYPDGACYAQRPAAGTRTTTTFEGVRVYVRRDDPLDHMSFWEMTEADIRSEIARLQKRSDITLKVKYADYSEEYPYMELFEGYCYYENRKVTYGLNSKSTVLTVGIQCYPADAEKPPQPSFAPDPSPAPEVTPIPEPESTPEPTLPPEPESTPEPTLPPEPEVSPEPTQAPEEDAAEDIDAEGE